MRQAIKAAQVSKIGERMADRRQLPIQYRQQRRSLRREHQIAEPVIAMRDNRRLVGRNIRGKERHELFHIRVGLRR